MFRSIRNLKALLAGISPKREPGEYYIVGLSLKECAPALCEKALGCFREREGMTFFIEKKELAGMSKIRGARISQPYSLITLNVYSDLTSVGFIAAVSRALAERGISVNVVSAYHHDHLLVAVKDAARAVKILSRLSHQSRNHA